MKDIRNISRTLAAILAASMLFSLAACGGTGTSSDTTADTTAPISTEPEVTTDGFDLPDKDFGGQTFTVMGRINDRAIFTNFEIDVEAENGDIVNDAIFKRNSTLEERYNVDILQDLQENPASALNKAIMAGDALYDAAFVEINAMRTPITSGHFTDLYSLDHLDFDKPWWNSNANEALEISGKLFTTSSAFSLQEKARIYFGVYNAAIAEQYETGDIQQMVLDGKWTIDKMNEFGRRFAADVNQDGAMDMNDNYSVVCGAYTNFGAYTVAQGNSIIAKDSSGDLAIVMNNEHMIDSIDNVLTLLDRSVSMYCNDFQGKVDFDYWSASGKLFKQNQAMFSLSLISSLASFSEVEGLDYRVMTFPKFDEAQERYYAQAEEFGLLFGIPSNAPDADFSAFMLEALSHESYTTTLPAYIEISAKVKHVYDEKSAQILDLIFDSVNYDFGFLYGIGGLNQILMAKIPQAGKNNFASLYASSEAKAQTELEKLLTTVAELE
ncbi:MAG: hypothetical protein E7632_03265 [Ruminococcaceae bacterium]|nr:hypothetical protein [Oscillospiraceae bacterium]